MQILKTIYSSLVNNMNNMKSAYFLFSSFFIRLIIIYAFGASSYLFTKILGPSLTGFFCDDNSIKLPYHDSTIRIGVLVTIIYILLFLTIWIVELICHNVYYSKTSSQEPILKLGNVIIHPIVPRALEIFVISQLGCMITIFLFNLSKYAGGRLRPNFVATCQPDRWENCKPGDFIQDYECLGKNKHNADESRFSFYSGHTAESFYYVVFLILYIHAKIGRKFCFSILLPILYVLLISGAFYVGCSRIWDHKHHPSDVFFGGFMGIATAVILVYYYRGVFFDINDDFIVRQDSEGSITKAPITVEKTGEPVIVIGDKLLQVKK
uniref:Phosphatidic acid phosphatase type 2/haloperoxidase domain-containing protein n=1 Tax=Acrobeloides nanus TaxID=290746 RepID=A0A914C4G2_9BILA